MGGKPTYEQYLELSKEDQEWLKSRLDYCDDRLLVVYNLHKNVICLTHAGIESDCLKTSPANLLKLKPDKWNRNHLKEEHWQGPEDVYLIHGHTPTVYNRYFDYTEPKVIRYCDDHKINIDTCAWYTGVAALLDMYTFEPIYFKGESLENNG